MGMNEAEFFVIFCRFKWDNLNTIKRKKKIYTFHIMHGCDASFCLTARPQSLTPSAFTFWFTHTHDCAPFCFHACTGVMRASALRRGHSHSPRLHSPFDLYTWLLTILFSCMHGCDASFRLLARPQSLTPSAFLIFFAFTCWSHHFPHKCNANFCLQRGHFYLPVYRLFFFFSRIHAFDTGDDHRYHAVFWNTCAVFLNTIFDVWPHSYNAHSDCRSYEIIIFSRKYTNSDEQGHQNTSLIHQNGMNYWCLDCVPD
jgi:hypothetical protein